jgi:hypothetical protein
MRGKDLAGIAALGTLGYMLSRKGKKDSDVDTSKISDMDLTGGQRSPAMPMKDMSDMKDTEFGDLAGAQDAASSRAVMDQFNQNQRAPSKTSLKTVKNAVRSGAMDTAGFEGIGSSMSKKGGFDNGIAREADRMQSLRDDFGRKKGTSTDSSPSFQDRMAREYLDKKKASDRQFALDRGNLKNGGKVVKMAKGGMTSSASSRGDGIAQKGKTRGKMC